MPTRRKPELAHQSIRYTEVAERFHRELSARNHRLLELAGFYQEFGDPNASGFTGQKEADDLINELAGFLATAATIRLDGGYKAATKVIATLKAIRENPALALDGGVEPEARGALALAYQRADEPPGKFWLDIYGDGVRPDAERVRLAAEEAIVRLKSETARGRPVAQDIKYLLPRLRGVFVRFNDSITRKMVESSRGNGDFFQKEEGKFYQFVSEVLAPLNEYLAGSPEGHGRHAVRLSAEHITRLAASGAAGK